MGVTPAAVLAWERPGCYPEAEKLPRIAKALGCRIDDLFKGDTPQKPL